MEKPSDTPKKNVFPGFQSWRADNQYNSHNDIDYRCQNESSESVLDELIRRAMEVTNMPCDSVEITIAVMFRTIPVSQY